MTDRAELRRLAGAANGWPWEHKHNAELIAIGDGMYLQIGKINDIEAAIHDGKLIAAASPDAVLGLLDEIGKLNAEIEDRLQAFDICHRQAMENGQARIEAECERDKLRAVLEAIANHNPAVTHGWAEQVREMARRALGGEPITDYRAVAVRLKLALQELESRVFEDGAPDDVLEETQGILADPEVEKL